MSRIFVPRDAVAIALGADRIAALLSQFDTVVRTGSRGLFWMEPMIEVETPEGRIAYGPVSRESVAGLFDAGFLEGKTHATRLGPTDQIPFLKEDRKSTRLNCSHRR